MNYFIVLSCILKLAVNFHKKHDLTNRSSMNPKIYSDGSMTFGQVIKSGVPWKIFWFNEGSRHFNFKYRVERYTLHLQVDNLNSGGDDNFLPRCFANFFENSKQSDNVLGWLALNVDGKLINYPRFIFQVNLVWMDVDIALNQSMPYVSTGRGQYALNFEKLHLASAKVKMDITGGLGLPSAIEVEFTVNKSISGTLVIHQIDTVIDIPQLEDGQVLGSALISLVNSERNPRLIVLSGNSENKAKLLEPTLNQLGYKNRQTLGKDMILFTK